MRLTLITLGSRGDIQPYVALGLGLQASGHAVRLATHDEFEPMIRERGLEFAPVSGNPREMLASDDGQAWLDSGGNPVTFVRFMRRVAEKSLTQTMHDSLSAARDADALVVSTLGLFPGQPVAEKLGLPLVVAPLQPLQPTAAAPNTLFPPYFGGTPLERPYNRATYFFSRQLLWLMFGSAINRLRREVFGLRPSNSRAWLLPPGHPILYGFSRHVIPPPPDWDAGARICGYWFLDAPADYEPPPGLLDFLRAGPPPVYVGFGSMKNRDPQATTALIVAALDRAGQRGVLLTGWGGLSRADLPETIFNVDSIPHDWLFPRVAAVVHHGGVGTTAAGLRAGVPSILTPFFADQPFWANRVERLGVGPKPIPRARLTAENLARAIAQAVSDEAMRARAAALGERIRAEDGVARAVEGLENYLSPRALRA